MRADKLREFIKNETEKGKTEFKIEDMQEYVYGDRGPLNRFRMYNDVSDFQKKNINFLRIRVRTYAFVKPENGNFDAILNKILYSDCHSDGYLDVSEKVLILIVEHIQKIKTEKLIELLSHLSNKHKEKKKQVEMELKIRMKKVKA
jgi:hypothetical protein